MPIRSSLALAIIAAALIPAFSSVVRAAEGFHQKVDAVFGASGKEKEDGVYEVDLPRSDLTVTRQGIQLKPSFQFTHELYFKEFKDTGLTMGEFVLLDEEVNPVMQKLLKNGFEVSALHRHIISLSPDIMFMHFSKKGDPAKLASEIRDALSASKTPLPVHESGSSGSGGPPSLDKAALDKILGHEGKLDGGVLSYDAPHAGKVRMHGEDIPAAMNMSEEFRFQPAGNGKTAATGEFVLYADEVDPVVGALRSEGLAVQAIHNHWLHEEPRLFYVHFWALDDAVTLARKLASVLDKVQTKKD